MYRSLIPIFVGFVLISYAMGEEAKKPDSKAGFDKKMKDAVGFMDKIDAAVSKKGVDVNKLLDVMSLLGPEFQLAAGLFKIAMKYLIDQPAQVNDTMVNGFAEVNSRLERIEARIKDLGNVVGDENTIAELRNRVGAVMDLQGEYIQYVNVSHTKHELADVLRHCRTEHGNPKTLVKFVGRSVPEAASPTVHNILGAIYNKASHNRTNLWNWFKAVILDCVHATTLELICQSLEERDEKAIDSTALELGNGLKAITEKMVQYDQLLIKEFANDEIRKPISLYDEIKELIQNYKTRGFDQGMADHLANYLKSKYDFAYWTVFVARDNVKAAWNYEHVIYFAQVLDKAHAKVFQIDAYMVIVNWAVKDDERLNKNKAAFKVTDWMPAAAKEAVTKGGDKCDDVLVQFSKTEWFPRQNISYVYQKHTVVRNGDPYLAGDAILTDCAMNPGSPQCKYWGNERVQVYNCYGFF